MYYSNFSINDNYHSSSEMKMKSVFLSFVGSISTETDKRGSTMGLICFMLLASPFYSGFASMNLRDTVYGN